MDGSTVAHSASAKANINIVPGRVFATIRGRKHTLIERDGIDQFLHFKDGSNWWAIAKVTGPESLLHLYGAQLALDFFEYIDGGSYDSEPLADLLCNVLESMPAEKGPIERGFITQIQRFATASTILPKAAKAGAQ